MKSRNQAYGALAYPDSVEQTLSTVYINNLILTLNANDNASFVVRASRPGAADRHARRSERHGAAGARVWADHAPMVVAHRICLLVHFFPEATHTHTHLSFSIRPLLPRHTLLPLHAYSSLHVSTLRSDRCVTCGTHTHETLEFPCSMFYLLYVLYDTTTDTLSIFFSCLLVLLPPLPVSCVLAPAWDSTLGSVRPRIH